MKKKYYYYVAILSKDRDIIYVKGTYNTTTNDFPIKKVEEHVLENLTMPVDSVVISFYKEITEETYKTYNND